MKEVQLDVAAVLIQEQMSNVTGEAIDKIRECLRLRKRARELEQELRWRPEW